MSAEENRIGPGGMEPTQFDGHRLALQSNGPVRSEVLRDGRYRPLDKPPGRFAVTPAGATVGLRWMDEVHYLLLTLAPALVARILAEESAGRSASGRSPRSRR